MLLLVFHLGSQRYALDAHCIVEVAPMVELEKIARAPKTIAGMFSYRGKLIPVVDMRQLVQEHPSNENMTTRIILVQYPMNSQESRILGLLGEQITETLKVSRDVFENTGITIEETPFLKQIIRDSQGMIHYVDLQYLLPETMSELLFHKAAS